MLGLHLRIGLLICWDDYSFLLLLMRLVIVVSDMLLLIIKILSMMHLASTLLMTLLGRLNLLINWVELMICLLESSLNHIVLRLVLDSRDEYLIAGLGSWIINRWCLLKQIAAASINLARHHPLRYLILHGPHRMLVIHRRYMFECLLLLDHRFSFIDICVVFIFTIDDLLMHLLMLILVAYIKGDLVFFF